MAATLSPAMLQAPAQTSPSVSAAVKRYWGFDSLRPLQDEAIRAGLEKRDSLVVMPTGGGKSLCYQVPPLISGRCAVVVSPLISLMKDQVDGLRLAGYPAAAINSNMPAEQAQAAERAALAGSLRLLFVAPERLLTSRFLGLLRQVGIDSFAIDEAHCISHWGHDFRPEYRRLAELRTHFPQASLHAFTATATPRVRQDIIEQLGLREPALLVGVFDRPNLTYRIVPARKPAEQLQAIVERHAGEAIIVYCISRKDTEATAALLSARGHRARAYHAGLDAGTRRRVQDEFSSERLNIVVATVAFGMGIDRSNVRCVVHANMPKSIEAYQQETGRAGRDGLPAECAMLYSPSDGVRWKQLMARSTEEAIAGADDPEAVVALEQAMRVQLALLGHMERLCCGARCRHRVLSEYFGQRLGHANCGACDVCLGELPAVADCTEVARKILSCVYRAQQHSGTAFGAPHLADILVGRATDRVRQRAHHTLSTFGQLRAHHRDAVISYIQQLADQGALTQSDDQFRTVALAPAARPILRLEREAILVNPRAQAQRAGPAPAPAGASPLDDTAEALFQELRQVRQRLAAALGVPPYVVFGDDTLREIAQVRPGSAQSLINVRGVGQKKLASFGPDVLGAVAAFCSARGLASDAQPGTRPRREADSPGPRSAAVALAFERFREGKSVESVAAELGRKPSTVHGYLGRFIVECRPDSIDAWVDPMIYSLVIATSKALGTPMLTPIKEKLGDGVSWEAIRLSLTHHRALDPAPPDQAGPGTAGGAGR